MVEGVVSRRGLRLAAPATAALLTCWLTVLPASAGPPPASAAVSSEAAGCPRVHVVGVRGSGERTADHHGFGRTVWAVVREVHGQAPDSTWHSIDYPAVGVGSGGWGRYEASYERSLAAGKNRLAGYLGRFLAGACGRVTPVVLVGYSQGAHVVGDVYQERLSPAQRARVAAVALIGDPRFRGAAGSPPDVGSYDPLLNGIWAARHIGSARSITGGQAARVRSYCLRRDPVCNGSVRNVLRCRFHRAECVHGRYDSLRWRHRTYTWRAAHFLV